MLDELHALLIKSDIKASKKLKEIKAMPGIVIHAAEIDKIEDFLSEYEFDEPREILEKLLDKI